MVWWDPQVKQYSAPRRKLVRMVAESRSVLWSPNFSFNFGSTVPDLETRKLQPMETVHRQRIIPGTRDYAVAEWAHQVANEPVDAFSKTSQGLHASVSPEVTEENAIRTSRRVRGQPAQKAPLSSLTSGYKTQFQQQTMPSIEPMAEVETPIEAAPESRSLPHIVKQGPLQREFTVPAWQRSNNILIDVGYGFRPDASPESLELARPRQAMRVSINEPRVGTARPSPRNPASVNEASASRSYAAAVARPPARTLNDERRQDGPKETLQSSEETKLRTIKNTPMLQAAKSKRSKQEIDQTENIGVAIQKMLEVARRRYHSTVVLEVAVGKLFVSSESLADEWKTMKHRVGSSFPREIWSSVFRTHKRTGNASAILSRKLTSSWVDAEYTIELTDDAQEPLFRPPPSNQDDMPDERNVVEIGCLDDRSGEKVSIVVDDKAAASIQQPWEAIGYANTHFPNRTWDARFQMKAARCINRGKGAQFATILSNLYVRGPKDSEASRGVQAPGETPFLSSSTGDTNVSIASIDLRREVIYQSNPAVANDVDLILTQVQRLRIEKASGGRFRAWLTADDSQHSTANRWWEMKLVSRSIDRMFACENPGLEIGEMASYVSWPQCRGNIESLLKMARMAVPKMDDGRNFVLLSV